MRCSSRSPEATYPGLRHPRVVEHPPRLPRQLEQVARVEPHPTKRNPGVSRSGDRVANALERVVRVYEDHRALREVLHERCVCVALVLERHHVRVGHRSDRAQAVAHRGGDVRRAAASRDRRGAGDLHRRVDAVVASRREVDHGVAGAGLAPASREHDASGLGRDHGLEVDLVEQQGLEDLGLDPRPGDAEQRLVREAHRPLGDRVDVAGEPEPRQVGEELLVEAERAEIVELNLAEAKRTHEPQRGAEPRREQPRPVDREPAREELEDRRLVHAALVVARRHRELVLIGQQAGLGGGE